MLRNIKKKIRHMIKKVKSLHKGTAFHNHFCETVVTEKELILQLIYASQQINLIELLVYGKDLYNYEELLTKVSVKFEFLGGLVYSNSPSTTKKLPFKCYLEYLLEGFYETPNEVKRRIECIAETSVSDEYVSLIYKKLVVAMYCCCLCIAEAREIWWDGTYRVLIEYAIDNNFESMPVYENIMDYYPKDISALEGYRNYLLRTLPEEIADKLRQNDTTDNNFRF